MSWAKFDDRFDGNRKVRKAWKRERGAIGLHVMAITHSALHHYDGAVDTDWLEDALPNARERKRITDVLVECGLWHLDGDGGFVVNDYLKFNPSRAEIEEKRRKDAERKRRAAAIRWDSARIPDGFHTDSDAPVPSRPVPTRTGSSDAQEGSPLRTADTSYLRAIPGEAS